MYQHISTIYVALAILSLTRSFAHATNDPHALNKSAHSPPHHQVFSLERREPFPNLLSSKDIKKSTADRERLVQSIKPFKNSHSGKKAALADNALGFREGSTEWGIGAVKRWNTIHVIANLEHPNLKDIAEILFEKSYSEFLSRHNYIIKNLNLLKNNINLLDKALSKDLSDQPEELKDLLMDFALRQRLMYVSAALQIASIAAGRHAMHADVIDKATKDMFEDEDLMRDVDNMTAPEYSKNDEIQPRSTDVVRVFGLRELDEAHQHAKIIHDVIEEDFHDEQLVAKFRANQERILQFVFRPIEAIIQESSPVLHNAILPLLDLPIIEMSDSLTSTNDILTSQSALEAFRYYTELSKLSNEITPSQIPSFEKRRLNTHVSKYAAPILQLFAATKLVDQMNNFDTATINELSTQETSLVSLVPQQVFTAMQKRLADHKSDNIPIGFKDLKTLADLAEQWKNFPDLPPKMVMQFQTLRVEIEGSYNLHSKKTAASIKTNRPTTQSSHTILITRTKPEVEDLWPHRSSSPEQAKPHVKTWWKYLLLAANDLTESLTSGDIYWEKNTTSTRWFEAASTWLDLALENVTTATLSSKIQAPISMKPFSERMEHVIDADSKNFRRACQMFEAFINPDAADESSPIVIALRKQDSAALNAALKDYAQNFREAFHNFPGREELLALSIDTITSQPSTSFLNSNSKRVEELSMSSEPLSTFEVRPVNKSTK